MMRYRSFAPTLSLGLAVFVSGCGTIAWHTSANAEYDAAAASVPRADFSTWEDSYRRSQVFVGVALSGGGSRAANFSAAVLEELEDLGFLNNVTAISSVSGGSLTGMYYALFRHDDAWSWASLKKKLRTNFFIRFVAKHFNPWKTFLTLFTHYDHSDAMAEVFDSVLYSGKRFSDLGQTGPKIFINATDLLGHERHQYRAGSAPVDIQIPTPEQPFVFTEEEFRLAIRSRLDTYPVSHAVMASGAFPLVFNNVTLRNYFPQTTFTPHDLNDPRALAVKWQHAEDPISRYFRENSLVELVAELKLYDGAQDPSPVLVDLMLAALNMVVWLHAPHPAFYAGSDTFPQLNEA